MRPFTVKTEGNFAKKSVCDARATIVIDPEKKQLFVLFYHLLEFYSFIISFFFISRQLKPLRAFACASRVVRFSRHTENALRETFVRNFP